MHADGLVRVVAQDGSVWWTRPEFAAYYQTLTRATAYDPAARRSTERMPASEAEDAGSSPAEPTR